MGVTLSGEPCSIVLQYDLVCLKCSLLARRRCLSLHGDDGKIEARDDLLGVNQVVDAAPVALGSISERRGHKPQVLLYEKHRKLGRATAFLVCNVCNNMISD